MIEKLNEACVKARFDAFIKNIIELQNEFSFVPLLYGSLGLEVLTGEWLNPKDIDILIPDLYINSEKWEVFKSYLESLDYILIDLHEHTFKKDNILFSYASIENLEEFAGIKESEIEEKTASNIHYKLLNLKQYLAVYEASLKDGYRQNKKEKDDLNKIELIKKLIKK